MLTFFIFKTLAVPLEHFLLLEPEFLQDIENHIKYKGVRCLISEASEVRNLAKYISLNAFILCLNSY